jgi:flagellar hook-associated protein 1
MLSSLNTGLSGLQAQRRVLDLIGHNISNAATPGYHRQRAELQGVGRPSNGLFSGSARAYGVDVLGVTRSYDALLAARAVREQGSSAFAELSSDTLSRLEGLFPEPTDVGLANQLQEFWSGWTDVANDPESLASRTALLGRASSLIAALHTTAADIADVKASAVDRFSTLAIEANEIATEIGSLNAQISSTPDASHDLVDQRELLVTRLAELTGAQSRDAERGQVDVYIGGRAIVTGAVAHAIYAHPAVVADPLAVPPVLAAPPNLRWVVGDQAVAASSGEAASLFVTITDIVPRYTAMLDTVAATLASSVNLLHQSGYALDGATTLKDFFAPAIVADPGPPVVAAVPVTAANIKLSVAVDGKPEAIAAGAAGAAPLDGEQARKLAALVDSGVGSDVEYRKLIAGLAVETRGAIRRADNQAHVTDTAISNAESIGSVSIDEEMANLVGAQRAYEASARFLTVIDELLGTLIQRTGVVGR